MKEQLLDCILVPLGLMVMLGYHVHLLHRVIREPTKTVVGVHAMNRGFWVHAMMELTVNHISILL